jgi:P27 family predicted phage terminase small subunit
VRRFLDAARRRGLSARKDGDVMKGRRPTPRIGDASAAPCDPPPCPDWLRGDAKDEWLRVMPDLCSRYDISPVDAMTLAAYCKTFADWRYCSAVLDVEGYVYQGAKGEPKRHPLATVVMSQLAEIRRIAEQFGFTPRARQSLEQKTGGGAQDEFEAFQSNGHGISTLDKVEVR